MRQARDLYGDKEGHHATPSEIAVTLAVEPSLKSKQRPLPDPAGPIHGPDDFRRRHSDGRMGSHPLHRSARRCLAGDSSHRAERGSAHVPWRVMSQISSDDVRKVAHLARLDLPEDTIATYTDQSNPSSSTSASCSR